MSTIPAYHVAQMNWGILKADWEDPQVAEFVDNLARVNAVAERARGFVWRLTDAEMDAAQNDENGVFGGDPRLASTLSVWETPEALSDFVHKTVHAGFMARSALWFAAGPQAIEGKVLPRNVIWPVSAGHRPTLAEGKARLLQLATKGASDAAYDFKYLSHMSSGTEAV